MQSPLAAPPAPAVRSALGRRRDADTPAAVAAMRHHGCFKCDASPRPRPVPGGHPL